MDKDIINGKDAADDDLALLIQIRQTGLHNDAVSAVSHDDLPGSIRPR